MAYLIVETKSKQEEKLIQDLLKKMNVKVHTEEEEDAGLVRAMREVDFSKTVPLAKLRSRLRAK